jgi:hypothetical protein
LRALFEGYQAGSTIDRWISFAARLERIPRAAG